MMSELSWADRILHRNVAVQEMHRLERSIHLRRSNILIGLLPADMSLLHSTRRKAPLRKRSDRKVRAGKIVFPTDRLDNFPIWRDYSESHLLKS